ncbi:protein QNR-71 [Chanos chanos]|uniref:Protein QNR-71 n=1 Tax=Chanos chanos TaxID=29144 RepID=A0A6J2WLJ2_CHACN|nr:transmembrane glycoprotein NMB [Chanos chanos]
MFPHKHSFPFPFPIPGWDPDTNPWDESLYPPFKSAELTRRHGNPPRVRLTSDSPAMSGSCITFTAALEYPKCQREDASGNLVYDEHCDDGMEASANGQVRSGYVYNWTSWLDDYGFGKCADLKRCNVFPDGKPFPQSNDWRRRGYVYVWHAMGQYFETCDGSSSSITLNTTNMTFGAGVMEVMVYRKRERRKYSPLSTDSTVFFVTDKIPLAVNISQKEAVNITAKNTFMKNFDIIFNVQVHDPSNYLKTAAAIDFIWDFHDGNQLITHSNVATHAYSTLGNITIKLIVEATFRIPCPPPTPTPMHFTQPHTTAAATLPPGTHAITSKIETTPKAVSQTPYTTAPPTTPIKTTDLTTEPLQTDTMLPPTGTAATVPEANSTHAELTAPPMTKHKHLTGNECFRYMYGNFEDQIIIIEPPASLHKVAASRIVEVSAAKLTNATVNFLVTCLGSVPTSACTVVSDVTCQQVKDIMCDDVIPPASGCQVSLQRTFREPGTYCVNITLAGLRGLMLATTTVTIGNNSNKGVSDSRAAEVVLSSSAVLVVVFACIAFMVYKRYKVYQPVRRTLLEDTEGISSGGRLSRLRAVLFPVNEERSHLLTERHRL